MFMVPDNISERSRRAVVRLFDDGYGRGWRDAVAYCIAPGAVDGVAGPNNGLRERTRARIGMLRAALPDLRVEITEIGVEGNRVAASVVMTGTHTGAPLFGFPPTGRAVRTAEFHLMHCALDGRIAEHWATDVDESIRRQVATLVTFDGPGHAAQRVA